MKKTISYIFPIYNESGNIDLLYKTIVSVVATRPQYDYEFVFINDGSRDDSLDKLLKFHRLGGDVQAIVIDFHGEASSEKTAMGYHADGRASLVVGTHTHIPTADARILPKGTGYQTDAGMCGSYDSVIGMDAQLAVNKFVRKMPGERLRPAEGEVTLCGVIVDTDDKTGLCTKIEPLRIGGVLSAT